MSSLPPNPHYAFVNISIGNINISAKPPNHEVEFEYVRKPMNSANTFTITVFDETALLLEYELIKGYQNIVFSYGYENGDSSPVYQGSATEYQTDFNSAGSRLTINGMSSSVSAFTDPKSKTYSKKENKPDSEGKLIHEIVKEIAEEEGWVLGNIVECEPVDDGTGKNKVFTRNNQTAQIFIVNELIPYAKSAETGDSNFILNFEDSSEGTIVNFYPTNQIARDTSKDQARSFEFQWGSGDRTTTVISFKPGYSGSLRLAGGGGVVDASAMDSVTNEMFNISYTNSSDPNRTTLGNKSYDYSKSTRYIGGSSYSMDEMKNIAAYMWATNANYPIEAQLNIMGDPTIQAYDLVSVVMLNKDGLPHHSSGVYLVKEITDTIRGGLFTTNLLLYKNASGEGSTDAGGYNVTLPESEAAVSAVSETSKETEEGTQSVTGTGVMTWPVPSSSYISSPYGMRKNPTGGGNKHHEGIDIAQVTTDTPIVAADDGTVIVSNQVVNGSKGGTGYGNVIKIDHGGGIITLYGHCTKLLVSVDQSVTKGQTIATCGSTGNSTGNHLHFTVLKNGKDVDPMGYVSN